MNIFSKAKKFWKENKEEIIYGLCIVGGIVTGAIIVKAIIDAPPTNRSWPEIDTRGNYIVDDDEAKRYEWDEDKYGDDWEKISIAANYLDLEEGESYVISSLEGIADDEEAINIGNVYLTHYVDDVAVNPPEEEDEDEDDYDEDDEDYEELIIKVPKDADDQTKEAVKGFISFIENGAVEIDHF